RIVTVEKRYARAEVLERTGAAATSRVTPLCAVFGSCGGCQLQHLSYAAQLEHKRRVVENALTRIERITGVTVLPTLASPEPWRYRNQVQVPLRWDAQADRVVPGFFAAASHQHVPTDVCALAPQAIERTIGRAVELLTEARITSVHHLIVRRSETTGEQVVVFVVTDVDVALHDPAEALVGWNGIKGVARTVQPRPHGPVWGRTVDPICGDCVLTEIIDGIEYLISPRSFFQVNTEQARRLYAETLAAAAPGADDTVLDAYCGTGTLGLLFARHVAQVYGIDNIPDAIADARRNAEHNGIANAEFTVGEVERVLPTWTAAGRRFDIAVLDPPRKGCDPAVLQALIATAPRRITYVSCNPATLARDLRILLDGGYQVDTVQPVDMFPQTSHVECVVATYRAV
ncbi:MAG: 23S rRNA (uracil(1939)-C(5))-methyltransferase RlmD, partial [Alicyclobacillus sp.]|nr:23S rRNA (uracil(1939)-C(5))-methyltransferase RlmD [Alicyclobacillus sp.]